MSSVDIGLGPNHVDLCVPNVIVSYIFLFFFCINQLLLATLTTASYEIFSYFKTNGRLNLYYSSAN